jgi:hypothetical protein
MGDGLFNLFCPSVSRSGIRGKKHHADAVSTQRRQNDVLFGTYFFEKQIRQLQQNAGPVPRGLIAADGTPVHQVFQHLEAIYNNVVIFTAVHIGHKPHAATVVFIAPPVKTL